MTVTLAALASAGDLTARNIVTPSGMDATTALAAATDAVRDAAGCPITQATSTIQLVISDPCWIDLPAGPTASVATVIIDGTTIAASVLTSGTWSPGWRLVGESILLTDITWAPYATATITYTHGYATVPADIVDLVCGLVAIAFRQDGDYGGAGRDSSVRLGEYSETQKPAAGSESPSPVTIPDSVRNRLRARFGTSVAVVGVRR
jgi:hypothetical protein